MKPGRDGSPISLESLAADWVDAFNAHELDRILAHYRDDVRLTSPVYRSFSGGVATAQGVQELRRYFAFGLSQYPSLRFTLLEVLSGAASVAVRYHTNIGDRICVECMHVDDAGLVHEVHCHYSGAPAAVGLG